MNAADIIGLLPASLAEDPASRAALEGLLGPVASVATFLDVRRRKLAQLIDPTLAPDAAVEHLATLVGVGADLPAAYGLDTDTLRALIAQAVALWKVKGTAGSWRAIPATLAGSRTILLDWFALRTITGHGGAIHTIPGPGAPGYPYSYPEFVTDLWYMDAGDDAHELVVRWLDVVRGANERINVRRALLVDDLLIGEALWEREGAGTWTSNTTAHTLTASDGAFYAVGLDGAGGSWASYHATLLLGVSGLGEVAIYLDPDTGADDCYRITLNQSGGSIALHRLNGGVATSLSGGPITLVAGHVYPWSFEAWTGSASTRIAVYWEGTLVLSYVDTTADRHSAGNLRWGATVGSATLKTALIWPEGVVNTRVGPDP